MNNKLDKFDWSVHYVDMYGDNIHLNRYVDLTKHEVWKEAERNAPSDREIQDFIIKKIIV